MIISELSNQIKKQLIAKWQKEDKYLQADDIMPYFDRFEQIKNSPKLKQFAPKYLQDADIKNIESFLNTITRFFSGAFQDDYFINYDTHYSISSMNSGKKYNIEDIERLNINQKDTEENKKLLDSLLYLHYTLERNIQDIFLLEREIGSVISSDGILSAQLEASTLRRDETKNSLITNLKTLHKQIEIVLHYFY